MYKTVSPNQAFAWWTDFIQPEINDIVSHNAYMYHKNMRHIENFQAAKLRILCPGFLIFVNE